MKFLGLVLILAGFLFGNTVNNFLVTLGLNITFLNLPIASLPLIGAIVYFVVSTTFIGLNIIGIQLGINFLVAIGIVLLILF